MKASSASRIGLVLLLVGGCVWFVYCDGGSDDDATATGTTSETPSAVTRPWSAPEPVDLTDLERLTEKTLALTDAQKFPDCHLIFEPDGAVEERLPLSDAATRPLTLAGCRPEAYQVSDDGTRYVAYAVPADGPGWDLRLVAYAPSDELLWSYRLDRSENAKNFTANFRRSFIAPLLPRLVCAGTLWEGGTQAGCVDANSGQEKWSGMMKFWAGISPQPLENALNAATLSGLSRRYPFSGVEMRFHRFEANGGRAAYYATDAKHLFFVPSQSPTSASPSGQPPSEQTGGIAMTAFDLATFEPAWHLELPTRPRPTWEYALEDLGVVLFKIDESIYAADTASGELLWAAKIGDDEPPVVTRGAKLYMLIRRQSDPNLIFELDPRSGEANWFAKAPTGTLELETIEDTLILRSVRAVQEVSGLE